MAYSCVPDGKSVLTGDPLGGYNGALEGALLFPRTSHGWFGGMT